MEKKNSKAAPAKKNPKNRKLITIISVVIIAAVTVGIVLGLLLSGGKVDYHKDNLGKYVYISEEDYKSYSVNIDYREADESDVNRLIMNLQYKNKAKEASYDGGNVTSVPITVGDKVYIYYRGYTVDENGVETDVVGATNFTSDSEEVLEIGSLTFVKGFEEGLIGVVPKEHERFEKIRSGDVTSIDVVYLSYRAIMPDGSVKNVTSERIDLTDGNTDKKYGTGFAAFLANGKKAGENIKGEHTFEIEGSGTALYYEMKVDFVTRCESDPVVVKTVFPRNYDDKTLRAKTVYFDVYVRFINVYEVAEYGDSFVLDVLKIKEDQLSKYEGESVAERFKAKLLEQAKSEVEDEKNTLIEEAMWEHYLKRAEFKKLPNSEVEAIEAEYYYELEAGYQNYSQTYSSLGEYAMAYYGLGIGEDYRDYIREKAEGVIKEKIVFYYVAREAGFVPTEEKLASVRDEMIAEYLTYYVENIYNEELAALDSAEKREKRIAEIRSEMISYYGEDYFTENAYYAYALEGMRSFANIFIIE